MEASRTFPFYKILFFFYNMLSTFGFYVFFLYLLSPNFIHLILNLCFSSGGFGLAPFMAISFGDEYPCWQLAAVSLWSNNRFFFHGIVGNMRSHCVGRLGISYLHQLADIILHHLGTRIVVITSNYYYYVHVCSS